MKFIFSSIYLALRSKIMNFLGFILNDEVYILVFISMFTLFFIEFFRFVGLNVGLYFLKVWEFDVTLL